MLAEDAPVAVLVAAQQQQVRGRDPEDGAGPVADEGEEADGDDVKAADAVVGRGEVDRGDGVGAAKGEEGCVLEEDCGRRDFWDGEVDSLEGVEEDVGKEK